MSTALAKVDDQVVEVQVIKAALAARPQGSDELVIELDESYMQPEDEKAELADIQEKRRILQWNGKKGVWKDIETGETSEERTGAILGKLDPGRTWFPDDSEKAIWLKDDYICRAESVNLPPHLNPRLTPQMVDEALKRGAGKSCLGCPMAEWVNDEPPPCGQHSKVLWFDATTKTTMDMQVGGMSIKPLRHHLAELKKKVKAKINGRVTEISVPLYARATVFGKGRPQDDGGKLDWVEVAPAIGPFLPSELVAELRQVRESDMRVLDEQRQAVLARSNQAALPAPETAVSVAASTPSPPPASTAPAPQPVQGAATPPSAEGRGQAQPGAPEQTSRGRRLAPQQAQDQAQTQEPAPATSWDEGFSGDDITDDDVPF